MDLVPLGLQYWDVLVGLLTVSSHTIATIHIVLTKKNPRSSALWVVVVWLLPIAGLLIYLIFGINRFIYTQRSDSSRFLNPSPDPSNAHFIADLTPPQNADDFNAPALSNFIQNVTQAELYQGNAIEILRNGDETYPAMIKAMDEAQKTISLSTYIFKSDPAGKRLVECLKRAQDRGVKVRVLIDGVGLRYSLPTILFQIRKNEIPCGIFRPRIWPLRLVYMNMRNHRKICVIDGKIGFTGGMNISQGNLIHEDPKDPISDLHFKIQGPVVEHLQRTFVSDWFTSTRKVLEGPEWFPPMETQGEIAARGIIDGPDYNLENLNWTLLAALSHSRKNIRILTPYFVPDEDLITLLKLKALDGIRIDIVLPSHSNLSLVQWASNYLLDSLLEKGVHIWFSQEHFDHSKLFIVDEEWVLLGSANWDARSIRLNFEFNVECYHHPFAQKAIQIFDHKLKHAQKLDLETFQKRPLAQRIRDSLAHLLAPYL